MIKLFFLKRFINKQKKALIVFASQNNFNSSDLEKVKDRTIEMSKDLNTTFGQAATTAKEAF